MPTAAPTVSARVTPVPTAAPATIVTSASSAVRSYIGALMRGDETAGYAALGGTAGERGLTLSEEAFLDPTARITSLRTSKVDENNATVECEIASSKGTYYATYHVTLGPRGATITQHDYIKV
ncbi:MAG: hypothetical protein NVSMB64_23930 [Candidatus Velthaea sp.]